MTQATSIEPVKLNITLKYRTADEFETGFSANVATGVVFLRTHMPKPVGTPVSVQLNLATGEAVLKGIGQVIHVWAEATMPAGHQSGMLVKFAPSDEASTVRIRAIIAKYGEGVNAQVQSSPKTKAEAPRVPVATTPPQTTPPVADTGLGDLKGELESSLGSWSPGQLPTAPKTGGPSGAYEKGFSKEEIVQSLRGDGLVLAPAKPAAPAATPVAPAPPPAPPRPAAVKPPTSAPPAASIWRQSEASTARPAPTASAAPPVEKKSLPSLAELVSSPRPPPPAPATATEPAGESKAPSLSSLVAESFRAKPKPQAPASEPASPAAAEKKSLPSLAELVSSSRPAPAPAAAASPAPSLAGPAPSVTPAATVGTAPEAPPAAVEPPAVVATTLQPPAAPAMAAEPENLLNWGANLGGETPDNTAPPVAVPGGDLFSPAPPPPAASVDPFAFVPPAPALAAIPAAPDAAPAVPSMPFPSAAEAIFDIPAPPPEAPLFSGPAAPVPPAADLPAATPEGAVVGMLLDDKAGPPAEAGDATPMLLLSEEVTDEPGGLVRPAMPLALVREFDTVNPSIAQAPFAAAGAASTADSMVEAALAAAPATDSTAAPAAAASEDAAAQRRPIAMGVVAAEAPRGPLPWIMALGIGLVVGAGALGMMKWWQSEPIEISWYRSANDKVRAGELLEAVSLYQNVIQRDPEFALAYRHLGVAFAMSGDAEQAKTYFVKYLEKGKDRDDLNRVRTYLGLPTR